MANDSLEIPLNRNANEIKTGEQNQFKSEVNRMKQGIFFLKVLPLLFLDF